MRAILKLRDWLPTPRRRRHWVAILAVAGTGAACVQGPVKPVDALIAPGVTFAIPAAHELGRGVDVVQLVTARYRDQTYVFESHITVTRDGLGFIGLGPFGGRALSIRFDDWGIVTEAAPELPRTLNAQNILADLAIIYWPAASVSRGLAGSPAALREDTASRSIWADGSELVHVAYATDRADAWNAVTRYRNLAFGYDIEIQSRATPS
jgi:uncharacterized protein DUF3261